jgi:polyhydroxyalkanoate synthesis repressor PhaR
MRTIKRYLNRKLYDTHLSHYITLVDILNLAKSKTPFVVLDNKTGEDITKHTVFSSLVQFSHLFTYEDILDFAYKMDINITEE